MLIGKVEIKTPIILAPMAGVTDYPFRVLCRKMGAGAVYSEFVSSEGIIRENQKTLKHLENRNALVTSFLLSINEGEKYGGCSITEHHERHGDLEYRYEISTLKNFKDSPIATNMSIRIYSIASWEGDKGLIFGGSLAQAIAEFGTLEEAEA